LHLKTTVLTQQSAVSSHRGKNIIEPNQLDHVWAAVSS